MPPQLYGDILIIDPSSVSRALTKRLLRLYSRATMTARSIGEARARLAAKPASVVIVDLEMPDARSFVEGHSRQENSPQIIVLSTHLNAEDREWGSQFGVLAHLMKPISLRKLLEALGTANGPFEPTAERTRSEPVGYATVVDPTLRTEQIRWDLADVSSSGAMVISHAPMPVGFTLDLHLVIANEQVPVTAEVVRIQEPAWHASAGLGVRFKFSDEAARQRLVAVLDGVASGRAT